MPDDSHDLWCLGCGRGVEPEFLARSGISTDLLERVRIWSKRSPKIAGVGIEGDFGPDLDDAGYVSAWRELRQETMTLLGDLRRFIAAEADVAVDVFETRKTDDWTDAEIVRWRHHKIRLRRLHEYGWLVGIRFLDQGGQRPAEHSRVPVSCPPELRTEEERETFKSAFVLSSSIGSPRDQDHQGRAKEIYELERRLGIRA